MDKELIYSFKQFVEWVLLTHQLSSVYSRQWAVFSHFLNIFPQQSDKLVLYSQICGDKELEENFVKTNLLDQVIFQKQLQFKKLSIINQTSNFQNKLHSTSNTQTNTIPVTPRIEQTENHINQFSDKQQKPHQNHHAQSIPDITKQIKELIKIRETNSPTKVHFKSPKKSLPFNYQTSIQKASSDIQQKLTISSFNKQQELQNLMNQIKQNTSQLNNVANSMFTPYILIQNNQDITDQSVYKEANSGDKLQRYNANEINKKLKMLASPRSLRKQFYQWTSLKQYYLPEKQQKTNMKFD